MAENNGELERRLSRLEMIIAVLLLSEASADPSKEFDRLLSILQKTSDENTDWFWSELFYWLRTREFPGRYWLLQNRLKILESKFEEISPLASSLSEEFSSFKQRVSFLSESHTNTQKDVEKLHDKMGNLYSLKHDIFTSIEKETQRREDLQQELHSYLALQSLGLDLNEVPMLRFLPLRVYISEADSKLIESISDAINVFADTLGFTITDSFPEEKGSWFKKWLAKTKKVATSPEVKERLQKGERALELAALGKQQADVDIKQAEAASKLISSLDKIPNAVSQLGSILIIKITDDAGPRIYSRSLTHHEMIFLEKNQNLLKDPQSILDALSKYCTSLPESPAESTEELPAVETTALAKPPFRLD